MIALIILMVVIILIIFRRIGSLRLKIWQIMGMGALAVLLLRQISLPDAMNSIDLDVIIYLFCVFVIGQALDESGLLTRLSEKIFRKAVRVDVLILSIIIIMAISSAFLMNDTVAVIGTPVVLILSRTSRISPKLMLMTLAFSITIGSVVSPIGNPQNLLVALEGTLENPFLEFVSHLFFPTLINLMMVFIVVRIAFRKEFGKKVMDIKPEPIRDEKLALLTKVSLFLILIMIILKICLAFIFPGFDLRLTYIALISMLPIVLFHGRRFQIIRSIDWSTLLFFISMFILMKSVWNTGVFNDIFGSDSVEMDSIPIIFAISIFGSQVISNVPLVALYLPVLSEAGASNISMIALAAGSTIAGNLTLIGAASNVIIVQNAEKRTGDTITFLEFFKIGAPLTLLNFLVYWVFLIFL
ncbi:MAG: anion transporter [Candidatus Thermoplasmatota archaeon]|nr:anion transporter [Candidatus Thermoplasmatota archaeon]